jgi:hypothetical protein
MPIVDNCDLTFTISGKYTYNNIDTVIKVRSNSESDPARIACCQRLALYPPDYVLVRITKDSVEYIYPKKTYASNNIKQNEVLFLYDRNKIL